MKLAQKPRFLFLKILLKRLYIKKILKEFQIPENIYLTSLNYDTGIKSALGEKKFYNRGIKTERY